MHHGASLSLSPIPAPVCWAASGAGGALPELEMGLVATRRAGAAAGGSQALSGEAGAVEEGVGVVLE